MTMIIARMDSTAKANEAKLNSALRSVYEGEWHIFIPVERTTEQQAMLETLGISGNHIIDAVVLGDVVPSTITNTPRIVPHYWNAKPAEDEIWLVLAIMAAQFPEALAQSANTMPELVKPEVSGMEDSENE